MALGRGNRLIFIEVKGCERQTPHAHVRANSRTYLCICIRAHARAHPSHVHTPSQYKKSISYIDIPFTRIFTSLHELRSKPRAPCETHVERLRSKPFHFDRRSTSTNYFPSATGPSPASPVRARSARSFARVWCWNIVKSTVLALVDDDVR